MPPVIRIPESLYSRLEKHAQGFDTPTNVIERLLEYYEQQRKKAVKEDVFSDTLPDITRPARSSGNTVEDWQECIEIALGFKEGSSPLEDNAPFVQNINKHFLKGEPAYGVSGVNAMEAYLRVIKKYHPDKLQLALTGLSKSIEQSDKPFHKMRALLKRAQDGKV